MFNFGHFEPTLPFEIHNLYQSRRTVWFNQVLRIKELTNIYGVCIDPWRKRDNTHFFCYLSSDSITKQYSDLSKIDILWYCAHKYATVCDHNRCLRQSNYKTLRRNNIKSLWQFLLYRKLFSKTCKLAHLQQCYVVMLEKQVLLCYYTQCTLLTPLVSMSIWIEYTSTN